MTAATGKRCTPLGWWRDEFRCIAATVAADIGTSFISFFAKSFTISGGKVNKTVKVLAARDDGGAC